MSASGGVAERGKRGRFSPPPGSCHGGLSRYRVRVCRLIYRSETALGFPAFRPTPTPKGVGWWAVKEREAGKEAGKETESGNREEI